MSVKSTDAATSVRAGSAAVARFVTDFLRVVFPLRKVLIGRRWIVPRRRRRQRGSVKYSESEEAKSADPAGEDVGRSLRFRIDAGKNEDARGALVLKFKRVGQKQENKRR